MQKPQPDAEYLSVLEARLDRVRAARARSTQPVVTTSYQRECAGITSDGDCLLGDETGDRDGSDSDDENDAADADPSGADASERTRLLPGGEMPASVWAMLLGVLRRLAAWVFRSCT
ncbi:hypothetical protein HDU83_009159 [Entophlyctis luteolus]|nr:hypothetical protein HDU83_009159 [Entophlyctis luteolus]